jgi:hypothetical protein
MQELRQSGISIALAAARGHASIAHAHVCEPPLRGAALGSAGARFTVAADRAHAGLDVDRDRPDVVSGGVGEIGDHVLHRPPGDRVVARDSRAQIGLEMLDRPGQRRRRRSVQCRRVPALGFAAGELGVFLLGAERVAWRVAAAAVAERLHEIGAAVPLGAP